MPIIAIVAAVQVTETLKLLTGRVDDLHGALMQFDVWRNEWRRIGPGRPAADCPVCAHERYEALAAEAGDLLTVMCGRDAVQVSPRHVTRIDLPALAERLSASGEVKVNQYLLRLRVGEHEMTVFQDARAVISGTADLNTARALYAKYIGN